MWRVEVETPDLTSDLQWPRGRLPMAVIALLIQPALTKSTASRKDIVDRVTPASTIIILVRLYESICVLRCKPQEQTMAKR